MNVYTCTFVGHYPVGAAAVVVAESEQKAATALIIELVRQGLGPPKNTLSGLELEILDIQDPAVTILLDGDY